MCGMLGGVRKGGQIPTSSGPMTQSASVLFKSGWISLAIIGLAILVFGLITTVVPTSGGPPYKDHIHQVVFIVLSLAGLLLPVREFFPRRGTRASTTP